MDSEKPTKGDAASHEHLSPPDLQQWMDTVWTHGFGFPARSTDVLVVQTISDQTFDSRADAITDVLWDHWMGEPEEPSVEQVRKFVVGIGRELAQATDEEPPEAS